MHAYIYIYIYSTKRTERHLNVKVYVDGKIKKKLKDINRGVDRKKKGLNRGAQRANAEPRHQVQD